MSDQADTGLCCYNLTNLNPYSAGIDFRRQNQTSVNQTSKFDPRTVREQMFILTVIKQKKPTMTFEMILNQV